jgi:hypothetical protein
MRVSFSLPLRLISQRFLGEGGREGPPGRGHVPPRVFAHVTCWFECSQLQLAAPPRPAAAHLSLSLSGERTTAPTSEFPHSLIAVLIRPI